MTTVDLGELGQQAEARRRPKPPQATVPGGRKGVPVSQVGSSHLRKPDLPTPEAPSEVPSSTAEPIATKGLRVTAAAPTKPSQTPATAAPLIRSTVHLNPAEDRYLERISFAGKSASPKVDISRSAVVRLAITKLEEAMSDDEIVAALGAAVEVGNVGGRPRR
ncbi:hypothetical protein GCM10023258_39930 [Terrabacter aeriphilus]|uniref:Centromere-binding protein ParB C-terminal domain-containing protein n=1 Tax=Terrabacter aeriphilus TaxID=515662 RepID=A0ABP9JMV9_9MICO